MNEEIVLNKISELDMRMEKVEDKINKISENMDLLPTKQEFSDAMDEMMKEIKNIRQENTFSNHRLDKLENTVTKLEEKVGI